MIKPIVVN